MYLECETSQETEIAIFGRGGSNGDALLMVGTFRAGLILQSIQHIPAHWLPRVKFETFSSQKELITVSWRGSTFLRRGGGGGVTPRTILPSFRLLRASVHLHSFFFLIWQGRFHGLRIPLRLLASQDPGKIQKYKNKIPIPPVRETF